MRYIYVASCLVFLAACSPSLTPVAETDSVAETLDPCTIPVDLDDGWAVANPCAMGWNASVLGSLRSALDNRSFVGIDGVVVTQSGTVAFEWYGPGYSATRTHDLRSATKSLTSILAGIAIDRGLISSVDEQVYPHFRGYDAYDGWRGDDRGITVDHLLTMTAGWDCNDVDVLSVGNERYMYPKDDWVRFILDLPTVDPPGQRYSYCTGGVVVLGEVLRWATGARMDQFAAQTLFGPLGISNYRWAYTPAGQVDTGGHIEMTARDMAKVGRLFLQNGEWGGEQLVSRDWVSRSTDFHVTTQWGQEYGYLWWRASFNVAGRTLDAFYANGNGGQFIWVVPEGDLVVTFTGRNYNQASGDAQVMAMMRDYVLRSLP